jgi:protein O-GlcNAc transferase
MITTGQNQQAQIATKKDISNLLLDLERNFKEDAKSHIQPSKSELDALMANYNQGLLNQAKTLAKHLTKKSPKHAMAWKILGVIYQQEEAVEEAEFALKKAAELAPKDAEAHYNLANFYFDLNELKLAQASYSKAVKLAPNFAKAYFNLAHVLTALGQNAQAEMNYKKGLKLDDTHANIYFCLAEVIVTQHRHKEAISYYKKSIALNPQDVEAPLKLGIAFLALNRIDEAIETLLSVIEVDATNASAHNALGLAYQANEQDNNAVLHFEKAIQLRADYLAPYKNLGLLHQKMGQVKEAEACYQSALSLDASSAETLNNLAVVLINQGRYPEAEAYCKQALAISPELGDAWNNLGLVFQACMMNQESEQAFEQALKYQPNNVHTLMNYGVTLNSLGKLTQAEVCLKKAIKLDPNNVGAYVNLSNTYLDQNLIESAISCSKKALEIDPTLILGHNNLLFAMEYSNQYSAQTRLLAAQQYGQVVAEKAQPYQAWNVAADTKRLRIGIVSGDLRQHPVAYFLKNAIKHLDYGQIELFAYTPDGRTDATTLELKPYFSSWKSLAGLSDASAAEIIHQDNIHILLDLSGHTASNKLPMFAWKPAPVQASWLGYWATTGVEAIDYILVDKVGVPEQYQNQFTEKVKYLPETRMCFTPPETALEVAGLPALENGYITFGCFQTMAKVSDDVLKLWAEVMQVLPNSRLRWQCKQLGDVKVIKEIKVRMSQCGIDTRRVSFHGKVSREEYLAAHAEVDFILDSFPFTGGTTTCEALWMGVPTLTLAGETMIARQGASLLTAAGLADWVAETKQAFVQKAYDLCSDLPRLAAFRAALRKKVSTSSLFNGALFAKSLEIALWEMWEEKQGILAKTSALAKHSQTRSTASNNEYQNTKTKLAIEVVSATRMTEEGFWKDAALGISLKRHIAEDARIKVKVAYENTRGLSDVFNESIANAADDALLVFIHDDVWIDQEHFSDSVYAGLQKFDVIGVAGNKRRIPNQPAWLFTDINFTWDTGHLSGKVAHGQHAFGEITDFGPVPMACELLDGVFLAAKKSTLINKQVKFDEQFDFHFYDLDFCRTARGAGLSLGTWPIKLTHQSAGAFGSQQWMAKLKRYLNKWENMSQVTLEKPSSELDQAINDVYLLAMQHQQNGDIEQAVSLYLEILQTYPQHADANHNLGFIEAHTKSINDALPRFEAAVMASPETEQFWVSYIDALMQSGATETALSAIEHGQKFGLTKENAQLLLDEYHTSPDQPEQIESLQAETGLLENEHQNVAVIQWQKSEEQAYDNAAFPESWLSAYPQSLMIEYTSRCNLRCKYCPKSNPGEDQVPGRNMDMVDETIDSVIALIKQYPYQELLLAGTGESTFHPNWLEDFPRIISAGKQSNPSSYIHLNSNFASKYEDVHWAVLSQLDGVVISIDTSDRQLTKDTRAKSDLGLIIYNIVRFQTYCELHELKLPKITINVTLYQQAVQGLPELMIMLSKLPVAAVAISDLYEGTAATVNGIKSINADYPDEFRATIKHLDQAINIAKSLGKFNFSIQPHLVERIQHIQAEINGIDPVVNTGSVEIAVDTKLTKFCLQPWTRFTLAADASIFPCCVTDMEPVGRIDTHLTSDGLDGDKLRNFRGRLLAGDVPSICVNCTNAPSCSTQQLQHAVQSLAETSHTIRPKQMVSMTKAEDGKRSISQQDIKTKIYQIFYSKETQKQIDQGFIPLDNLENSRPDWFEYWPIRNYLLNTDLDEDTFYGFLSPKFKEKTGLTANQVADFIEKHGTNTDVISFSPFFDQSSYYLNNFIQAMSAHSENAQTFVDAVAKVYPDVDLFNVVMDTSSTIFCNYFVAKPKFWREWLACCEKLFIEAEQSSSNLARALNNSANYDGGLLPVKVFVIERIASLILATQPDWQVQAYDSKVMTMGNAQMGAYLNELTAMSDLKSSYLHDKDEQHLVRYYEIREAMTTEMWHHKLKSFSLDQVLAFAQELREENKPYEVEKIYRHVLTRDAQNAEANHYLGVLEAEQGEIEHAILKLETAVMASPQIEQYWVSYIDALMFAGAFDTAALAIKEGKKYGLTTNTAQMLENDNKQQMSSVTPSTNTGVLAIDSDEAIGRLLTEAAQTNVKQMKVVQAKIVDETASSLQGEKKAYISADLDLSVFRETINTLMSNHQVNEVLEVIHKSILSIKFYPAFVGNKIFTPYFDEVLSELEIEVGQITPRKNKLTNVVLATEVYNFGGHTKDIIAILKSIDNPILIMTDIYHQVAKQGFYEKIASSLPNCPVFILPKESFIDKATRLAGYINNYAKNVFLLSHHDDSVAIAACQKKLDVNYYFIHHADHNPALGNHVKHLKHVDLFEARSKLCQEDLQTETIYLPTTASDQGAKSFIYPINTFSTVTAGTFAKFQTTGALSLASIVMASLQISRGHHYHFGEIPSEQLALIYAAINEAGYTDDHFVYMGNVPSLWQALLEIDAHIFIGSAPVMGAKSDIEAQGAGYPLLAYKEKHSPRHLNVGSHSAETVYWSNIDKFKHGLEKTMSSHQHLSQSARDFYLTSCSEEQFKQVIKNLSQ